MCNNVVYFVFGFLFCMISDILFSIANYFVSKRLEIKKK